MNKSLSTLMWVAIGALGAAAFGVIALARGETISASWLVLAGVCTYLVAYRFYSRYLAYTVFGLDDRARDAGRTARQRPRLPPDQPVGRCSATTSRPSPARGRSWDRRSPPNSGSCPARSGSSRASCSAAPCRT